MWISRIYKDVSKRRQEQPYCLEKENLTQPDHEYRLPRTRQHSESTEQ